MEELQVYKQGVLNTADFGNFNQYNHKVFLYLLAKIGGVDDKGKYLPPNQLKRKHLLTTKEFQQVFNTDKDNTYKILQQATKKLMKSDITLDTPETYTIINVCSQAVYNKNEGSISIEFTDSIMPYLAQVKAKFTLYNLKEISNFKSLYTIRLYELLQDFKETGWMLKSVVQLRHSLGVGKKFKLYGHLKKKTFGYAVEEINKIYKIDLKFKEIKEGRKVTALKFTFNKTKIVNRYNPKTGDYTNEYVKPERQEVVKNKPTKDIVLEGQMKFEDAQNKNHIASTLDNMFKA